MSHHIYTTEGFVIGSRPQGEANKYLYIFTRDLGMVGASAQGVRLGTSKLKAHVQDFAFARFSVVRGKEVWRLTSAVEAGEFVAKLRRKKSDCALYVTVLSLLKRLLHGEEKNEALFDTLTNGFTFLAEQEFDTENLRNFEYVLVFRVVHLLGYIAHVEALAAFLGSDWNIELITKVDVHKKSMIAEINRALTESQL